MVRVGRGGVGCWVCWVGRWWRCGVGLGWVGRRWWCGLGWVVVVVFLLTFFFFYFVDTVLFCRAVFVGRWVAIVLTSSSCNLGIDDFDSRQVPKSSSQMCFNYNNAYGNEISFYEQWKLVVIENHLA